LIHKIESKLANNPIQQISRMTTYTEAYPLLVEYNYKNPYPLQNTHEHHNTLLSNANKIKTDDEETLYLDELESYLHNEYLEQLTKIKLRNQLIEKSKNFDISKVKELPTDLIFEISRFLEPELTYTKKFMVVRNIRFRWHDMLFTDSSCVNSILKTNYYLEKVSKKIIMDLVSSCNLDYNLNYPKKSNKKSIWCYDVYSAIDKVIGDNSNKRIDKLLDLQKSEGYVNSRKLDRLYKFLLHINTFKKYKEKLEKITDETNEKLKKLRNQKIEVKN